MSGFGSIENEDWYLEGTGYFSQLHLKLDGQVRVANVPEWLGRLIIKLRHDNMILSAAFDIASDKLHLQEGGREFLWLMAEVGVENLSGVVDYIDAIRDESKRKSIMLTDTQTRFEGYREGVRIGMELVKQERDRLEKQLQDFFEQRNDS